MMEDYSSIMKNDVWEVVLRPEGKLVVTSRWLYKIKHATDGSIKKFKARFVARGFLPVEGVDYEETFALVARYTSIRSIISIAVEMGLEVWQEEGHFFLGQGKYIVDILSRFHMEDNKPMSTPMITNWKKLHTSDSELVYPTLYRQLINCLMYLLNTQPDICFAVNTMSQFICEPRRMHWVAAKHILCYLQRTVDFALDYRQGDRVRLAGYTDSDWVGCASYRKSNSRCCFGLGSAVVSWISRKQ
eukprot:PITA_10125